MAPQIFLIICIGMFVIMVIFFFYLGKKAVSTFPDISTVNVLFRQEGASGRANDSLITKAGGASGVLDVVVTDKELWVKTGLFFGWIAKFYKILNKIPLSEIIRIEHNTKRKVDVHFRNDKGNLRSITLKLSEPEKFIAAIEIN